MIRVLLVDDQALVRSGFRVILESEPDIEVVGEAVNGVEAVALADSLTPDVICMDVEMPEMNGIDASRQILGGFEPLAGTETTAESAAPAILILTTFGHEQYLFDALAAGVSGFLLKTSQAEQLIDAVRTLASGGALLGPEVTRVVIEQVAQDRAAHGRITSHLTDSSSGSGSPATSATAPTPADTPATPPDAQAALKRVGLTEREQEVLMHLALGQSNGEIASALHLGEATVKTHVSNLLQKLGARDRIQAIVWAHSNGITRR